jgi:hypothetical protein
MTKLTVNIVKELLENLDCSLLKKPEKDKGKRGKALEKELGIPNTTCLTDLSDGELKSYKIGETIAITQLNHCLIDIIDKNLDFEETKVFEKMKCVIYVAYDKDGTFINWKIVNLDDNNDHYKKIKEDYEFIRDKINLAYNEKKLLNTITGPNKVLQIRTKASINVKTNQYPKLIYNDQILKDKYMAFYLCSSYGKELFND